VDAVHGVCCTWCMLYTVDAVHSVCCTQCMLYVMYAVLSFNSWSWHGEIETYDLTLCAVTMVELWTSKREMGDEDENEGGAYEWIWEIRSMTCLIGSGRPHIGVITRQIGTHTCYCGDGTLTCTQNSLRSSFSWWCALYLSFSSSTLQSPKNTMLSHPSLSLNAMIKS
jgi:hypothetical protein